MQYNEEIIRQVAEANDIVEIISQYVTLKKSGSRYMACCPFHNEKTPSFTVSPDKQMYHCFGCGVGGDVFTFVREQENMSFTEALAFLADRAGITLPKATDSQEEADYNKRKRIYELNRQSANFYYKKLTRDTEALHYLKERGFSAQTIKHFGMGVSGKTWNELYDYLKSHGFSDEEMVDSGMISQGEKGRYDRFRNRIMIPILSTQDRVIAFGGRRFRDEEKGPKYLNSPETPVFSKSYELYHLNEAKKNIVNDAFIIVEGYMDVIALWQHGILNAVAALGTAFTPYHAKTLSRYVKEVVLCFDGDNAGKNATVKAIDILKKSPLNVRVIRLDPEDDPDSFIRKNGLNAFNEKMRSAVTVTEFTLDCLKSQYNTGTNDGRVKYLNAAADLLRFENNAIALELYVKKAAREGDVTEQVLMGEIGRRRQGKPPSSDYESLSGLQGSKIPRAVLDAQKIVLKAMISDPGLTEGQLTEKDFSGGTLRRIYQAIIDISDGTSIPLSLTALTAALPEEKDQRVLSSIVMSDREVDHLQECIDVIKQYHRNKKEKQELRVIREEHTDEKTKLEALNRLLQQRREKEEGGTK